MKKVKTIFMSLFLAASVACAACSCDMIGQSTDTVAPQSSIGTENSPAESIASSNGSFNFDEVCKNIVINGKQYTFPFSVEELGEGYSIGDISYSILDQNDEYYSALGKLYYNNLEIADICYFGVSETEISSIDLSNKKIEYLKQSSSNEVNDIYIEVDSIKIKCNSKKVIEKFGNPSEENNLSVGCGSYIYNSGENTLTYLFMDYKIDGISISVNKHH